MTVQELCGKLQMWAHDGHAQSTVYIEPPGDVELCGIASAVLVEDGRTSAVIIEAGMTWEEAKKRSEKHGI